MKIIVVDTSQLDVSKRFVKIICSQFISRIWLTIQNRVK